MKSHVLDIETISQDPAVIMAALPPWDIDEARTRLPGNYKKEATVNEWLELDRLNHGKDLLDKAALLPEYATVAIVGLMTRDHCEQFFLRDDREGSFWSGAHNDKCISFPSESDLLVEVWDYLDRALFNGDIITGHHIKGFDLAFLLKRSWLLGVPVPQTVFNPIHRYPLSQQFVDLREVWAAGRREDLAKRVKLQDVLKSCNLPLKTGDGSEFGKLWESDRAAALEYNRQDCRVEYALAERLGVAQKPSLTSPSLIASMDEIGVLP